MRKHFRSERIFSRTWGWLIGLFLSLPTFLLLSSCSTTSATVSDSDIKPIMVIRPDGAIIPAPQSAFHDGPDRQQAPLKYADLSESARFWFPLLARLTADGLDSRACVFLFSRPEVQFDPAPMKRKLNELYRVFYGTELTRDVQVGLTALGYTPGRVDGRYGTSTRLAITAFQQVHGLPRDGKVTEALLALVRRDLALPPKKRPRAIRTPVEVESPPTGVYRSFLTPKRLQEAEEFYDRHRETLSRMSRQYGVPAEYVVGILRVETHFGSYLGDQNAFNVLASMALCSDFKQIRPYLTDKDFDDKELEWLKCKATEKGDWAYEEIKALIQYAQALGRNPLAIPGSVYGAIGISQFMPTNALKFGVDADQDGKVDLFDMDDAIHSVGNYFRGHGWHGDMPDPNRRREVIYSYNRSARYANTVMAVANHLSNVKVADKH